MQSPDAMPLYSSKAPPIPLWSDNITNITHESRVLLVKTIGKPLSPLSVTLPESFLYTSFVLCYTVLRRIELEVLATVDRGDTI
ncbi:hypothetical protein, partial [Halobacterium hubeiense]